MAPCRDRVARQMVRGQSISLATIIILLVVVLREASADILAGCSCVGIMGEGGRRRGQLMRLRGGERTRWDLVKHLLKRYDLDHNSALSSDEVSCPLSSLKAVS